MTQLERNDIQGFLLSSYAHLPCATYLLLQISAPSASRRWLSQIIGKLRNGVKNTAEERSRERASINLAVTYTGLQKLGLSAKALDTFPRPFREGMATEERARILGDVRDSHPARWKWGNAGNPVDIILLVFAQDENALAEQLRQRRDEFGSVGGIQELLSLSSGRQHDTKEHFGFADGIGQPVIESSGNEIGQKNRTGHATVLKAGEFILGYENDYGTPTDVPAADGMSDFGRNGTYLVFRQLSQDVAGFWRFLDEATRSADGQSDSGAQRRLAAKLVGRWMSGAPLVKHPDHDPYAESPAASDENDFEYDEQDKFGFGCPLGAHIRRANPRNALGPDSGTALKSANRHRIIRRGRSYGDRLQPPFVDDGADRGLHFICLNGDIERQFEFIQQTWINNKTFAGLHGERDPLIGNHDENNNTFTVQGEPARTRVHHLRSFVTVEGGAYFFLPGFEALKYLANLNDS